MIKIFHRRKFQSRTVHIKKLLKTSIFWTVNPYRKRSNVWVFIIPSLLWTSSESGQNMCAVALTFSVTMLGWKLGGQRSSLARAKDHTHPYKCIEASAVHTYHFSGSHTQTDVSFESVRDSQSQVHVLK